MNKLSAVQAQQVIDEYASGISSIKLAYTFGISVGSVCDILRGKTWKQLHRPDDIKSIDYRKTFNGVSYDELPFLTDRQLSIFNGSMLGDGSITSHKNKQNSSFVKSQCPLYKEYLEWHIEEFVKFARPLKEIYSKSKPTTINRALVNIRCDRYLSGLVFDTVSSSMWNNFELAWYCRNVDGSYVLDNCGRRIKKIPDALNTIDALTLAVWFCDDGSNTVRSREASISTQNFSIDEVDKLRCILRNAGLYSGVSYRNSKLGKKQAIIRFSGSKYDTLIDMVRPHVTWACFAYKVERRIARIHENNSWSILDPQKVEEIIRLRRNGSTYVAIAEKFGVTQSCVSSAARGLSWKHLDLDFVKTEVNI